MNLSVKSWAQSPAWFWFFVISAAVCVIIYQVNLAIAEVHPGNLWGLSYGAAATALMAGALLLGLRKRTKKTSSRFHLGASKVWVQFHVYGGVLFLLLMFMHGGFRVPSGALTWWLWMLSIWVAVSGIIGVILQKWIPRILTSGLALEVIYERIPELIGEIKKRAEETIQTCADPVKDFYAKNIAAALVAPQPRLIYYVDITGGINSQMKQFEYLHRFLSIEEKEKVNHLAAMYKSKLEIDAHYTLQRALRWWLYAHVPVSLVLLVLVGLHLYAVAFY